MKPSASMRYADGSTASWDVGNEITSMFATRNLFIIDIGEYMTLPKSHALNVLSLHIIGTFSFLAITPAPEVWSVCS